MDTHKNSHISEIAMKNKQDIGIIGFGNFGKFIAKHLVQAGFPVLVCDTVDKTRQAEEIRAKFVSLNEVCKSKIIILAMPMENLEETLHQIKDKLKPTTIILDVCSLKMFACEAMNRILPKNVEIIGTHPLFGPRSAPGSLAGMKIVLVNIRTSQETFQKIKNFCEKLNLKVILATAEEHDKQMAFSQALTHFIGQVMKKGEIKRVEMSTLTFDKIMDVVEIISKDSPSLFNNMQTMNPFAKQARDNFVKETIELNNEFDPRVSPYQEKSS